MCIRDRSVVEEYLSEAMDTFTVHGRGSAIVMNVKTGAILAMATVEQFDPNDPYKIADAKMTAILDKEEIDANDIDWLEGRLGEKAVADIVADGRISREKTTDENGNEVSSEYTQLQGMMREAQWKNKNITELYMPCLLYTSPQLRRPPCQEQVPPLGTALHLPAGAAHLHLRRRGEGKAHHP